VDEYQWCGEWKMEDKLMTKRINLLLRQTRVTEIPRTCITCAYFKEDHDSTEEHKFRPDSEA